MESEVVVNFDLGISFPPVADEKQRAFTAPLLRDLNVKSIRIGENWKFREPTEGNFNWSPLDKRMKWAHNNQLEVLLTIQSNGPDWACSLTRNARSCVFTDNQKFRNYIEALLRRYPDQITRIQFGNEWQTEFWYSGDEQAFVAANNIVYEAVQRYSPQTIVVLGGFTTISLRYLAGCNGLVEGFYDDKGNRYDSDYLRENCDSPAIQSVVRRIEYVLQNAFYDEADIHLYDDAENWNIYFENFQSMVTKPIIISEFGGPNVNVEPVSASYQRDRLVLYLEKINSLPVEEAYYFKLVEGSDNPAHSKSGLISFPGLAKKPSYYAFKAINNR